MFSYNRAYIVGDVHLDARIPSRERAFCRFLDLVRDEKPDALFLLGDIFEFWFGYSSVMFSRFIHPIVKLGAIRDLGVPIHYLVGNHDFLPGPVFSDYLDFTIHEDPIRVLFGNTMTYLSHGDEINIEDRGYLFLKSILRNRMAQRMFRVIPASLAWYLGRFTSDTSRSYTKMKREMSIEVFENFARSLVQEHVSVIVHGHTHTPMDRILHFDCGQIRHINAGHWFGPGHYVEYSGGNFKLNTFRID